MRQAIGVLTLKHVYMISSWYSSWGWDWLRLWKNSSEGAEEIAVGRSSIQRRYGGRRVEEDMVLGLFLVQSLYSSGSTPSPTLHSEHRFPAPSSKLCQI